MLSPCPGNTTVSSGSKNNLSFMLETISENLDTKELETTKDILEEIDLKLDK